MVYLTHYRLQCSETAKTSHCGDASNLENMG